MQATGPRGLSAGEQSVSEETALKTKIVSDWQEFDALADSWNALLSRSRSDIIFLRWEWIHAWRRVQGDSIRPFVVTVRDGNGDLVGVAPFYRTAYVLGRVLPYKCLRIMGDFPTGAECLDWIVCPEREKEVARRIAETLADAESEWDFLWMPYVPTWTGARDRMLDAAGAVGFPFSERDVPFGALQLPEKFEELINSLGSSHRYNTRRDLKRTFADPATVFSRCLDERSLPRFLDSLFRLHADRWGREGQLGTFRKKPNERKFYETFAPVAHDRGWLRLYGVEMAGELKAVQYGFLYNGAFLQIQEGFDHDSGRGLGNLLRFKVIEELIRDGIRVYDFLAGVSEHKKRWHAAERVGRDVMVGSRKLKSRLLFAKQVWPTGRYLRHVDLEKMRGTDGKN